MCQQLCFTLEMINHLPTVQVHIALLVIKSTHLCLLDVKARNQEDFLDIKLRSLTSSPGLRIVKHNTVLDIKVRYLMSRKPRWFGLIYRWCSTRLCKKTEKLIDVDEFFSFFAVATAVDHYPHTYENWSASTHTSRNIDF